MSAPGANDNEGPFSIGQDLWPGIAKLAEECGEVIQVIGKLIATGGRTDHWSGLDLRVALEDEIADLRAAIAFVAAHNETLNVDRINGRVFRKTELFEEWHRRRPPL
jgi:NTP pyrophosphatase (non-canonical NTP hydrolase)